MVADISVSGTKLHVSYSDGTSKDMDMPPATSLRLPYYQYGSTPIGYVDITAYRLKFQDHAQALTGRRVHNGDGHSQSLWFGTDD